MIGKTLLFFVVLSAAIGVACSGAEPRSSSPQNQLPPDRNSSTGGQGQGASKPSDTTAQSKQGPGTFSPSLDVAQRDVIYTATLTVETEAAQTGLAEVRRIAEGLGGFVDQLATSGSPDRQSATITIRVPQGQFFNALEKLEGLGKVRDRTVKSEDVTDQYIDLQARLEASRKEEQRILVLLDKSGTLADVLTLEKELARVRTDIEKLQGQLNFLARRINLSTITVTLSPPQAPVVVETAPSAGFSLGVRNVSDTVEYLRNLVVKGGGIVDKVSINSTGSTTKATMSLLVRTAQFKETLSAIEDMGRVKTKRLDEGPFTENQAAESSPYPNARIDLALVSETSLWVVLIRALIGFGIFLFVGAVIAGTILLYYRKVRVPPMPPVTRASHGEAP